MPSDLVNIRARHVRVDKSVDPQYGVDADPDECWRCDGTWPCDTAVVLAALDVTIAHRDEVIERERRPDPRLDALLAALRSEDEIAHGEAWDDVRKRGLGVCAYCDGDWPCRTQQGIDRALAAFEEGT